MITDAGTDAIQRELEMVQSAIDMVAGRHAWRVTVGGLSFGDQLLAAADRMASGRHVHVVPLWGPDEHWTDIRVERDPDD
jgi:hypothetical protein